MVITENTAVISDRWLPVKGFNTKQWWIYDEVDGCYVDIPSEVLKNAKLYENETFQEMYLSILCNAEPQPDWLFDMPFRYYDDDFEI